uniref:Trypsin family protein n=1 Tax=Rhizobium rhizogenes TaxID=359 RepID=A0A7S4ZTR4_RHIRH|nr:trypsin-like serine protease [Rhizobium rhizogenes]QCL09634.1 trypsin family protein [Rhizobium rhizogenes]
MKPFTIASLSICLAFASAGRTYSAADDIVFASVASLHQNGLNGAIVKGTKPANTGDWPATLYAQVEPGSHCTATIVGPQAVLLAAHCVPSKGTFSIVVDQVTFHARCTIAPGWLKDESDDYAMCAVDGQPFPVPAESISTTIEAVKVGTQLLIAGFGCNDQYQNGSGTFRIGHAPVVRLPNVKDANYVFDKNSVVTQGSQSICPGDSGGGAYLETQSATGTHRVIVAVNSRVDLSKLTSYLSSMATPDAVGFLNNWMQTNNQKICGLGAQNGCRN